MDACVLIDFLKTDRSVLKLISECIGPVHVIGPVVTEVRKRIENENELVELGLCIIEPELQDGFRAVSSPGPTSFQDRLCFLVAKREGLTLISETPSRISRLRWLASIFPFPGLRHVLIIRFTRAITVYNVNA